ncbi:ciliary microtubule inner protein 4 [Discoglossus pictus]
MEEWLGNKEECQENNEATQVSLKHHHHTEELQGNEECPDSIGGHQDGKERQQENPTIPPNPKYGNCKLDQPTPTEEVIMAEEGTHVPQHYSIPKLIMKPWLEGIYPHGVYYDVGQCLRANIFPGIPIHTLSLVRESYTKEVNDKGRLPTNDRRYWRGRRTDDLAVWSQILMERDTISKQLQTLFKPPHPLSRSIRPKVPMALPPPTPIPPLPPAHSGKRKVKKKKCERPHSEPQPVEEPTQDDDFWNFYDKPSF